MRKSFKAFTLVEMLIVMGIIIILMAVGITAGRYAINRANDVAHQNGVDNFYTAAQAYYADSREYPDIADFEAALTDELEGTPDTNYIGSYMDEGAFDGGTDTTYFYATDDLNQEVMICVSLYGMADNEREGNFYCNGNGFGSANFAAGGITDKVVPRVAELTPGGFAFDVSHDWEDGDWAGAVN